MFRFSMDITDAIEHGGFAPRYGIVEDRDFSQRRAEAFARRHPGFIPHSHAVWTAADVEYDCLENEMVFRWDSQTPRAVGEAVELVREAFFYPPLRVWLEEEEYNLAQCRLGDTVARYG